MKRKFSLLINLATLVLCISAIAIGVYSAKQASLNVSGTVGFTAHDCKVEVTGTIKGHATGPDDAPITTPQDITSVTVKDTKTLDLGEIYFSDMTSDGEINPITLTLNFENLSDFDVEVNLTKQTIDGMTITPDITNLTLSDKNADMADKKKSVIVTLTCTNATGITKPEEAQKLLQVDMAKYTPPTPLLISSANDFFWNKVATNTRSYVTMGQVSESDPTPLRWYIFAKGSAEDNMKAVTGAVETNEDKTLKAGTYWFISEYVLNTTNVFGSNNVYEGSTIQTYLEGDGTSSFTGEYKINKESDSIYTKITGRTLNDAADEYNHCGALTTSTSQKLWLLSVKELSCLNNNEAVSVPLGITYKTITAKYPNSDNKTIWRLRTPFTGGNDDTYIVDASGFVCDGFLDQNYGIRPAFQITIPA